LRSDSLSEDTSDGDGVKRSLNEQLLVTDALAVDLEIVTIRGRSSSDVPCGNNVSGASSLNAREASRSESLRVGLGGFFTSGDGDGGRGSVDAIEVNSVDADGVSGRGSQANEVNSSLRTGVFELE
jgi:hypothetical protein